MIKITYSSLSSIVIMGSLSTLVDLEIIVRFKTVFERCYSSITHGALLSDPAPFRQTLEAENVPARRARLVLVWSHTNGARSVIINRFTSEISGSHDSYEIDLVMISA